MRLSIILLLTSLSLITSFFRCKATERPVMIFPGLLSNSIWQDEKHPRTCFKEPRLWYNFASAFWTNNCWDEAFKLRYDNATNMVSDSTFIKFHNFGTVNSIMDIGEHKYPGKGPLIFKDMVEHLESLGLRRNYTIKAIQMDWRKSVTDFSQDYYNAVRNEFVNITGYTWKQVTVICHSYGCLNLAQFILRSDPTEISTYIHRIITLGAPWKGSTKALKGLLSGDNFGRSFNWESSLVPVMKTFTSLVHLIPDADILADYYPFVLKRPVGAKRFTDFKPTTSIAQLLNDFKIDPLVLRGRQSISTLVHAFSKLDKRIKIYCVYGNIPKSVLSRLYYSERKRDEIPILSHSEENGDGDGTVPLRSLKACEGIGDTEEFPVLHQEMLSDGRVLNYITRHID